MFSVGLKNVCRFSNFLMKKKERRKKIPNQCCNRSNCRFIIARMFAFHGSILDVKISTVFLEEVCTEILYSISTRRKWKKILNLFLVDEQPLIEYYCSIGTSDWLALVNVSEVSCWSWMESLNICVIINYL